MSVQPHSFAAEITKTPVKSLTTAEQIIQQFKLNHGLFLDGNSIKPSEQAIFVDSDLDISLYKGSPIVYIKINNSPNLCINYPIAEFTFKGEMSESFSEHMDD